jgi:hypothetical protein
MPANQTNQPFQVEAEALLREIDTAWPSREGLLSVDRANRTALRNWLKRYHSPADSVTLQQVNSNSKFGF